MTYVEETFRMVCEVSQHNQVPDSLISALPRAWRGVDWRFDWQFNLNGNLVGVDGLATLTMEIKSMANITGSPLLTCTINSTAIDNTLTAATWADGTKQHATFLFSHTDTNLDLGGQPNASFFIVCKGTTNGNPSNCVVMGVSLLRVDEAGANNTSPPSPGDPNYYTAAQADNKFLTGVWADDPLYSYTDTLGRKHIGINPNATEGQTIQYHNGAWTMGNPVGYLNLRADDDTIHTVRLKRVMTSEGPNYQIIVETTIV